MTATGQIGDVRLRHRSILGPGCGVLNLPMRMAFRRMGAGMTCIGVIDAAAVAARPEAGLVNLLGRREATCPEEQPVSVQLIGADPAVMAEAAARIEPVASIIDLNFSGPLRQVLERGFGAAMLTDPHAIGRVVRAVVERVHVPVTAKVRIGIHGRDVDVVGVARACEAAGASAITAHARWASEGYAGPAHWEAIAAVKKEVAIPVIGNGAVGSAADAKAMVDRTGCDFVMICTAAFVDPLIFQAVNALLEGRAPPATGRLVGLLRFMTAYYALARELEGRGRRRAFKRAFRQFLAVRAWMKKLQAGRVGME